MSGPVSSCSARELELDVARMDFDENGLREFFWPLSRGEQQAQRDNTLVNLVALLRERLAVDDGDARMLAMCIHWLINETQLYFRATALERRCREAGVRLRWQDNARLLPAVASGKLAPLENGRCVSMLNAGPAGHNPFVAGMVKVRRSIDWNGAGWHGLRPVNMGNDIVACYRAPLLDIRARNIGRTVKQTNLQDWFRPMGNRCRLPGVGGELAEQVIGVVADGYRCGGEVLPEYQADYFRHFMNVVPGFIRTHYEPILRDRRLPKILWTGSGGYIYNRMLRNAVRQNGGYVVGHEHASGDAHLAYFSAKPFIEYESADEFVTYSDDGARSLRANFDASQHLRHEPPVIVAHAPANDQLRQDKGGGASRANVDTCTLMYPTTMLMGERVNLDHIVGDNVMVDWSARLMSRIVASGYTLIHKPHPEESMQLSKRFAEKLGVRQTWERFENVYKKADAVILDFSRTTIFHVALASDLPIIYIDFGYERWHPYAYELLKKRVRLVNGWIDRENRLQVDWTDLFLAIRQAGELKNKEIVHRFYPHVAV